MEIRFDKKVVVITGAAGGIGSAMTKRFVSDGATVIIGSAKYRISDLLNGQAPHTRIGIARR